MTLAISADVSAAVASGDVTLPSWTPGANELVLVGVHHDEALTPTLAGNGLTFASVLVVDDITPSYSVSVFRAQGASPSTGSIVATIAGNSSDAMAIAVRISGAVIGGNGADAIEATGSAAAGGLDSDMLGSVTTLTADALLVGFGGHGSAGFTVPGGETLIEEDVQSGGAHVFSAWYEGPIAPAALTQLGDVTDLDDSVRWALALLAIKPATALTAVPNALMMMGAGV